MQENEFEKQVRELMDAFKLSPSEDVWEKIEPQIIKQQRKRRWIVLFFLFADLMVSGYFIYNERGRSGAALKENAIVKNEKSANKNPTAIDKKDKDSVNKSSAAIVSKRNEDSFTRSYTVTAHGNTSKKLKEEKIITANKNENQEEKDKTTLVEEIFEKQKSISENKPNFTAVDSNRKEIAAREENNLKSREQIEKTNELTEKKIEEKNRSSDSLNKNIVASEDSNKPRDTINKTQNRQLLKDSGLVVKDSPVAKTETRKQLPKTNYNKKWQWGITAFYGRSDIFQNFLGIKNFLGVDLNKSADASFAPSAQGGGNYTDSNALYSLSSKRVKSKRAFSVGLDFKKPISKKSSLIAGLHYTRLKTSIETGGLKDSAASFRFDALTEAPVTNLSSFYTSGQGSIHTNRYSFLQIPIIYEYGITKNNTINLNAGLSLNRLVESNALLYDSYNRAYYSNKNLLRKTQINFVGGINAKLTLNKMTAVHLGPQFQYSLSNFSKYSKYDNQHLFSWGLKASVFFHK